MVGCGVDCTVTYTRQNDFAVHPSEYLLGYHKYLLANFTYNSVRCFGYDNMERVGDNYTHRR